MLNNYKNNFAFIDSQNLNLGVLSLGWKLDYRKFRIYLTEKYQVKKAYMFIGFISSNQSLYDRLQSCGFVLKFKPTIPDVTGKIKGNVDADLVLQILVEIAEYNQAILVSNDGDFYSLINYLYTNNKLKILLSPNKNECSFLLRKAAKEKLQFMNDLREKLSYKREEHRLRTEP